jgi:hypothetical protein
MRWHLSLIMDEIEPSERGRHALGARKKSERETRKPRCAKPSTPKLGRRRMKPVLDWTKSKAEAHTRRAARARGWRHAHYFSHDALATSPFLSAEGALLLHSHPLAHPKQGPCPVDVSELFLQDGPSPILSKRPKTMCYPNCQATAGPTRQNACKITDNYCDQPTRNNSKIQSRPRAHANDL